MGMASSPICHFTLTCSKSHHLGYPKKPKTLGEHIKKRRFDLKLQQKDVAPLLGVCVQALRYWELGTALPKIACLPKILAFLGYDPRTTPKTMPERLVAYRAGRGWNQKRLAEELNVDPTTLARWETGKKKPWGIYIERVEALLPKPEQNDCEFKVEGNGCCDHSEAARKGIRNRRR